MKVKKLKDILQNAIDLIDEYEDNDEIVVEPNTYFLREARIFLGINSYDGGYVNLDEIQIKNDD